MSFVHRQPGWYTARATVASPSVTICARPLAKVCWSASVSKVRAWSRAIGLTLPDGDAARPSASPRRRDYAPSMDEQASFEARAVLAPRRARRARLLLLLPVVALV